MKIILLVTAFIYSISAIAQDCPIGGDSKHANVRSADSLKNRTEVPGRYKSITTDDMLQMTIENNTSQHEAVKMKGYVLDIKNGGVESCNCHSKTNRDTHIYIVKDESIDDISQSVIVEVTPHFRDQLGSTADLKKKFLHKEVIISGYLFMDEEHKQNSTIDAGKGHLWRGTTWEIHPVTDIELQ